MTPREPLALHHTWPLWERGARFDLGRVHDEMPTLPPPDASGGPVFGTWRCHLATSALGWSSEVHRLFGVPADATVRRHDILAIYAEESRAALERLRAHALRHCRGFTLDVIELYGTKQDVTADYL